MKAVSLIIIFMALSALLSCDKQTERVNQESHAIKEVSRFSCITIKSNPPYCSVDFVTLYADRHALDGKVIGLIGYVGLDNGVLTIYATESDYRNAINNRALTIRANVKVQEKILAGCGYKYCVITGTFMTPQDQSREVRLGLLLDPNDFMPIKARELNSTDLSVSVEDLSR